MKASHALVLVAALLAGCGTAVAPRAPFVSIPSTPGYPEVLVRRPPRATGPIDAEAAGLAVARQHRELQACYEAVGGEAAGRGVVYALMDIDRFGSVRDVTVGHSDVRDARFERCLVSVLATTAMPEADASSAVQAHLVFGAQDEGRGRALLAGYRESRAADRRDDAPVTVAGLRGRIQPCYERALRQRPGLRGRTVLELTLDEDGSVADAAFSSGDELGDGLGRCVLGVVRSLTLLRDDPSTVTLSYPVILEPGAR